ncbi:MAG TPA: peptide ABC transporter substrate-binding protein [Bacillales bacterium]|nr:peptide ABC transporter substrate-binding protein [Bacillales bacterium]
MKGKSKWSLLLALVFVLSLFLSACSGGGGETTNEGSSGNEGDSGTENKTGGDENKVETFNIAVASEIPTMDTSKGDDEVSFNQFSAAFEGLFTMNSKGEIVPAEATGMPEVKPVKVKVKDDKGKEVEKTYYQYTFHLRDGIVWSNGEPVTAEDYVYAWQRLIDPKRGATYSYLAPTLGLVNAAEIMNEDSDLYGKLDKLGVKAVDDKTLQMTLVKKVPDKMLLSLMQFPSFFPIPKDFAEEQGDQYALEPENLLFNGPYVMTEWKHNEGWTYKKNDKYWDKENVDLEEIHYKVVKEQSTRVNLYEVGKLDIVGLSSQYVKKYQDNPEFHTALGTAVFYFMLNEDNKFLDNVNIRKALALSWNKKQFTDVLLNDGSIPAWFLVPKDFAMGPDGKDFRAKYGNFGEFNPEKAKEYWQKGLDELGVDSIKLEVLAYPGKTVKDNISFVINQWEQNLPGFEATLNQQEFKVMLEKENSGQYQIAYAGWGPDYQDPMTFMDLWVTGGGHNDIGYSNPEYDKRIEYAKTHPQDAEGRWTKMQEAEKILFEDQAIIPMYQEGSAYLLSKKVKNFANHPFGPDYTWKYWEIEE